MTSFLLYVILKEERTMSEAALRADTVWAAAAAAWRMAGNGRAAFRRAGFFPYKIFMAESGKIFV